MAPGLGEGPQGSSGVVEVAERVDHHGVVGAGADVFQSSPFERGVQPPDGLPGGGEVVVGEDLREQRMRLGVVGPVVDHGAPAARPPTEENDPGAIAWFPSTGLDRGERDPTASPYRFLFAFAEGPSEAAARQRGQPLGRHRVLAEHGVPGPLVEQVGAAFHVRVEQDALFVVGPFG